MRLALTLYVAAPAAAAGAHAKAGKGTTTLGAHKKRLCVVRTDVSFDPTRDVLTVHVHEVDGLSERKFGKPDLYVKLYLAPDPKKKTKVRIATCLGVHAHTQKVSLCSPSPDAWQRKTVVVKGTLAPVFNEAFTFPVAASEVGQRSLRMALWQRGTLGNQVLGEVAVELAPYASRGAFKFSEQLALSKRGGSDAKATASGADGDDDAGACYGAGRGGPMRTQALTI